LREGAGGCGFGKMEGKMSKNCIHSVYTFKANVYTLCIQNALIFFFCVYGVYTFFEFAAGWGWVE